MHQSGRAKEDTGSQDWTNQREQDIDPEFPIEAGGGAPDNGGEAEMDEPEGIALSREKSKESSKPSKQSGEEPQNRKDTTAAAA